ncbi:hypothetical protein ACFWZ5_38755, partial [Streptomyces sp. NPDC059003]
MGTTLPGRAPASAFTPVPAGGAALLAAVGRAVAAGVAVPAPACAWTGVATSPGAPGSAATAGAVMSAFAPVLAGGAALLAAVGRAVAAGV